MWSFTFGIFANGNTKNIFDGVSVDVYPTMSTNEKPRNVKRGHYLSLHTFFLNKCRNVVIVLWKTMIFKLLSSFCHLIHVSANSQLAHQIWWFRMMSDVVGSLVSWESCYFIIFNYKHGQDECCRCFSGALHYHIVSCFLNKPCVLLLFYLWRFVCIYIICIKISDWMRHSQIRVLWGIRVVQTFWSANWCLLSAFELFSQICTWRVFALWCVWQCSNSSKSIGAPSKHL